MQCTLLKDGQSINILLTMTYLQGIHTGRVVGQIAAQLGPYNLLWCPRYKNIVPTRPYYSGDRRANCLKYCKQIVRTYFCCNLTYHSACVNALQLLVDFLKKLLVGRRFTLQITYYNVNCKSLFSTMLVLLLPLFWCAPLCQCQFIDILEGHRFPTDTGLERPRVTCSVYVGRDYAQVKG